MKNILIGAHDNARSEGYHERHSEMADVVLKNKLLWVYAKRKCYGGTFK